MIDLRRYSDSLSKSDQGIWIPEKVSEVSYPDSGSELSLSVEDSSFWFNHRNRCILQAMTSHGFPEIIFDVGGGNGFVSAALQMNGFEPVLVEPGLGAVAQAEKRGVKNIIRASFDDAKFKEGIIPAAGLFDVLEHIKDQEKLLAQIFRALLPEGCLVLTVPAFNFLWSYEDDYAGHYRRYTLKSLAKIVAGTGFKIEYGTYFFRFLPIPIFLFRSLPTKLRLIDKPSHDRTGKEHSRKGFGAVIEQLLKWEAGSLEKKKRMHFGSSCLLVGKAQK